jgi:ketosteroid isomerase-like protein
MRDLLLEALMEAARTGDFSRVLDHLAEDVEFSVSIAVRSPTKRELFGRESVIAHLRSVGGNDSPTADEAVDVFAGEERIVATGNAIVAMGDEMALSDERTLVCDLRDGLIRRLVVYHELSHAVGLRSKWATPARPRSAWTAEVSVAGADDA